MSVLRVCTTFCFGPQMEQTDALRVVCKGASVKEIKQEIFEILTARCLNCFLSVKSIALVVFLLVGALPK